MNGDIFSIFLEKVFTLLSVVLLELGNTRRLDSAHKSSSSVLAVPTLFFRSNLSIVTSILKDLPMICGYQTFFNKL